MASADITINVNIPWLTMDERDCIVANLVHQRRRWLDSYHSLITVGNHDRANRSLDHVIDFDRMIAKVEAMSSA